MKKRILGVAFGTAMFVGVLGASPAMARSDATVTVICSGGQVIVADAHALHGMVTSAGVYTLVNPFGEICTVYP